MNWVSEGALWGLINCDNLYEGLWGLKDHNAIEKTELISFIENETDFNVIALPEFQNINEAPKEWIWNVLYKNLENEENKYTYEQIQEKLNLAKHLLLSMDIQLMDMTL